jgi:hypothetical protein
MTAAASSYYKMSSIEQAVGMQHQQTATMTTGLLDKEKTTTIGSLLCCYLKSSSIFPPSDKITSFRLNKRLL